MISAQSERQVRLVGHVEQGDDHERDEGEDEGPAGQSVETVGDVDAVARADDGERREDDVRDRPDDHVADERHADAGDVEVVLDVERRGDGHDDLPEQLLADADAVARLGVQPVVGGAQEPDADERAKR